MTELKSFPIVAFIHIEQQKLLIVRPKKKTVFYMPGGKVEKNETPYSAVSRECKEELSIELIPSTIKEYCSFTAPAYSEKNFMVDTKVYTGMFTGAIQPSNEIAEIQYVTMQDYCTMPEVASVTKIVLERLYKDGLVL